MAILLNTQNLRRQIVDQRINTYWLLLNSLVNIQLCKKLYIFLCAFISFIVILGIVFPWRNTKRWCFGISMKKENQPLPLPQSFVNLLSLFYFDVSSNKLRVHFLFELGNYKNSTIFNASLLARYPSSFRKIY